MEIRGVGGRGEKLGSTGHRNISLSIRRETRCLPCLTEPFVKGLRVTSFT